MSFRLEMVILALSTASSLTPPAASAREENASFQTKKHIPELERCLTKKLSRLGDVTTFNADGMVTVMVRTGSAEPLLLDLHPPTVTATTRLQYGTRRLVEACL
jgi:hypothetical protein